MRTKSARVPSSAEPWVRRRTPHGAPTGRAISAAGRAAPEDGGTPRATAQSPVNGGRLAARTEGSVNKGRAARATAIHLEEWGM
ncbi:hypothetical protein GCM10023195_16490 [Actinoallomurus liliacearum]|uniref:Uncharacterized protein n=1 Tax=Actinoallomurus liliacearum TaxID=1080073 RepID=A0ABP8TCV5_9ACTN